MPNLVALEIKAFVPARDFELSKSFYQDLGFDMRWCSEQLAYFCYNDCSFLLQNFYVRDLADNFMMHLLVRNVDQWWQQVVDSGVIEKYGVKTEPPEIRPWGMKDFVLADPCNVLWRIGENT